MNLGLKKREMSLLLLLLTVLGGSYLKNKHYLPKKRQIKSLMEMNESLTLSLSKLKDDEPDLEKKETENQQLREKLSKQIEHLHKLGSQIPHAEELDQFLFRLTFEKYAKNLKFHMIEPVSVKESKSKKTAVLLQEFKTANYRLDISGTFADITNYLIYLEKLSPFIKISSLEITQDPEKKETDLFVKILFSILISHDSLTSDHESFQGDFKLSPIPLKSPFLEFVPSEKTREIKEKKLPEFKISGIVTSGNEFRVIIHEQIYREGDFIGETLIKKILKNKIILETEETVHEIPFK